MYEYFKPQFAKIDMKEMEDEKNRIKMCYCFIKSKRFSYQELAVVNPDAHRFDGVHVMPADLFAYTYESWAGKEIKALGELELMVSSLKTDIYCIGSHDPHADRTIQLICLSQDQSEILKPADLMIVQFLVPLSQEEKLNIINTLKEEYWSL